MASTRRAVLGAGGTFALLSTAGCLGSLTDSAETVPLCEVSVTNADDEDRTVSLRIRNGEETVYEDTVELRAVDRSGLDHAAVTREDLPGDGEGTVSRRAWRARPGPGSTSKRPATPRSSR